MRLAFISTMNGMPWGGSEALWYASARLALAAGHQVLTITNSWPETPAPIRELARLGAETRFRPGYNPELKVRLYRRVKEALVREPVEIKQLKAFNPDRIIVNQGGGFDLLYRPELQQFLRGTGIPYYLLCHNYNEELVLTNGERELLRALFTKARQVFMICRMQADTIRKQLVHPLPHIRIAANPLNLKETGPLPLPTGDTVQLAAVATFHVDRKGQDILLEVLSEVCWKDRDWQLNLYGEGPHREYLEALIPYFGLEGRVRFRGHVADIRSLWKENHLLLLSSRIETGPMVLQEAMLCGRVAVATRVGRVPELLEDGHNGFVAGAPTPGLYAEALERAWAKREHWQEIGANAWRTATADADPQAGATFLALVTG